MKEKDVLMGPKGSWTEKAGGGYNYISLYHV